MAPFVGNGDGLQMLGLQYSRSQCKDELGSLGSMGSMGSMAMALSFRVVEI